MSTATSHETPPEVLAKEHGVGQYLVVFVALCFLTGASFFTYSSWWPFHQEPMVGWIFMMAVSCTKATLVMMFFMHLKWEANWKFVLTIPPAIMSMIVMIALVPDIGLRYRIASSHRRAFMPEPLHVESLVLDAGEAAAGEAAPKESQAAEPHAAH